MLVQIIIILIILCGLLIWFIATYNKFQTFIKKIKETEKNIDSVLRKRYDLLNKSITIIKQETKEENILKSIEELKNTNLSTFEFDRKLYDGINEFSILKEKYKNLKDSENFVKIEIELTSSEAEISALRKYYNDIITDYNKLARLFPSLLVAKICRYKQKTYFDEKNMNDKNKKDFKV